LASSEVVDQASAFELLESYLSTVRPASSWWPLAYAQYLQLAEQLDRPAKSTDDFRQPAAGEWRTVTSIDLGDDELLGLAQPSDEMLETLGQPDSTIPIIGGTNLKRYCFEDRGVSVLASREVLAVFLQSPDAPAVTLNRPGLGGDNETLTVGMSRSRLEELLGDEWDVEFASIDDPDTVYHLYRGVGVAARYDGDAVQELVVVVAPRKK
ncbi:MAG: hypothetical protein AAF961_20025, partial [Planctomycetota bacterium]